MQEEPKYGMNPYGKTAAESWTAHRGHILHR